MQKQLQHSYKKKNGEYEDQIVIFKTSPYNSDDIIYLTQTNSLKFNLLNLDDNNMLQLYNPVDSKVLKNLSKSKYFKTYYKTLKHEILISLIAVFLIIYNNTHN